MTENYLVPSPTDRERAKEIADHAQKPYPQWVKPGVYYVSLFSEIEATLASVRAETVEQAAMLVAGWTTAVNAKAMIKIEEDHCSGVAERDFAMADAIRALAKTAVPAFILASPEATLFRAPSQSLDRTRKERAVIDAARVTCETVNELMRHGNPPWELRAALKTASDKQAEALADLDNNTN